MEIVACVLLLALLGGIKFFFTTPVGLALTICLVIAAVIFFITGSWIAGLIVAPLVFILILWLAGSADKKQCRQRAARDMAMVDGLSGYEFEEYIAALFKVSGYKNVRITQQSNDFGADVLATDEQGQLWVIQCKRYTQALGNAPVQEVYAAKAHYGASVAAVATNTYFTEAAKTLAAENGVILLNRESLIKLAHAEKKQKDANPQKPQEPISAKRVFQVIGCVLGCAVCMFVLMGIAAVLDFPWLLLLWIPTVVGWCFIGKRKKTRETEK